MMPEWGTGYPIDAGKLFPFVCEECGAEGLSESRECNTCDPAKTGRSCRKDRFRRMQKKATKRLKEKRRREALAHAC